MAADADGSGKVLVGDVKVVSRQHQALERLDTFVRVLFFHAYVYKDIVCIIYTCICIYVYNVPGSQRVLYFRSFANNLELEVELGKYGRGV